jgi:hypothetical protein
LSDIMVCREHQFALGRDASGVGYMSMPGTNSARMVDYEGFFALTEQELDHFLANRTAAVAFAARCRRGEMSERRTAPTDDDWTPFG